MVLYLQEKPQVTTTPFSLMWICSNLLDFSSVHTRPPKLQLFGSLYIHIVSHSSITTFGNLKIIESLVYWWLIVVKILFQFMLLLWKSFKFMLLNHSPEISLVWNFYTTVLTHWSETSIIKSNLTQRGSRIKNPLGQTTNPIITCLWVFQLVNVP